MEKVTYEEVGALFPLGIPMEAIQLCMAEHDSLDDLRAKLKALATPTAPSDVAGLEVTQGDRGKMSHHAQMLDAAMGCVPCKLCGGKAIITDAGTGAGYYIRCENSLSFQESKGCIINDRRLGGWAYNVMEWWNRLHDDTRYRARIRAEALEEAARVADESEAMRVRLYKENEAAINAHRASEANSIAAAIRALAAPVEGNPK